MTLPKDRRYAASHEWATKNGQICTIGISDFAVKELGDLVYLDLPAVGKQLQAGASFGEIESVKAVSELYAPVSGKVVEINSELEDSLELLVNSPFDAGWMIKVEMSSPAEYEKLLDAASYQKKLDEH
ncbi:MAG: glycine cleavage system protein GcvH [Planctomycetota bacterium]